MSLTTCIKKAGDALNADDKAAILDRARELRTSGLSPTAAAKEAVEERVSHVQALLDRASPEAMPGPTADSRKPRRAISDFGEKIEGARKDYAAQLKDAQEADVAAVPLSQSWPEPNYQKMLDGGGDPFAVAFARAARDEIPTKPLKRWKLRTWVDNVKLLRGVTQQLMSGEITAEALRAKLAQPEFANVRQEVGRRAELYQAVGHGQSLKDVRLTWNQYSVYKGEKHDPPLALWVVEKKAAKTSFSRWPTELATGKTREEAIEAFKAKMAEAGDKPTAKRETTFAVFSRGRRAEGQTPYFVGKKIGREVIELRDAPDVKAAREIIANNRAELDAALEKYRETPLERNAENRPRVGDNHRLSHAGLGQVVQALIDRSKTDAKRISDALVTPPIGTKSASARQVPLNATLALGSGDMNAALNQNFAYMAAVAAEVLRNFNDAGALSVQGFSGLNRPSRGAVQAAMLALGHDAQIRRGVVQLVPVDVVHLLARQKLSADGVLGDDSVLGDLLAVNDDPSVRAPNAGVLQLARAIAQVAAEGSFREQVSGVALKDDAAVRAGQFNSVASQAAFAQVNVSPEDFQEAFSFRGVQFGNYVENERRQSDLNQAYDALMDLAAVLDVPPRALSLNGQLGLAFGARGHGGKNAAAAHYEPDRVVINLTKGAGPGSLAHEWWHSLDNYFARQGGAAGYMTDGVNADRVRDEMKAAFERVKLASSQTGLLRRSAELDKRKSKPYWNTAIERSARSFESYIIAKLQDQGAANDYLANIVSKQAWDASEGLLAMLTGRKQAETYPYPTEDEMVSLRAAFDGFFKTVEAVPEGKNVVLREDEAAYNVNGDSAATERAYGGREAYDRAKAAGRTKLTYGQWVQVRTPAFKAWFGDWEAVANREFLDGSPIASLTGDEFKSDGVPLSDKVPKAWAANGHSTVAVEGIGPVALDGQAVKNSLSHGIGRDKAAAFAAVPDVLRGGRIVHREPMQGSVGGMVYHVAAPISIGGRVFVADVLVRADNNMRRMYVHEVVLREALQRSTFKTGAVAAWAGKRASVGTGAIRSVLERIYSVNPDAVSKIVDPDTGEPLVVYHGSGADIESFDTHRVGANSRGSNAGVGAYFSQFPERSSIYAAGDGGNVGAYFLRVVNPASDRVAARVQYPDRGKSLSGTGLRRALESAGHDGIVNGSELVAFEPTQIKSAIGNNGAFGSKEPSTAAEPGAQSTPYETDLFGNPLPAPAGNARRARPDRAGVRGNVQPAAGLPDTPAPAGDYLTRTYVGSEVARRLGASRITSAADAAAATRYLYESAVERFDGIVTDKDGKPLAVIGGFKGALSQTSVYPATLLAEAVRVPGAAKVWFSHNHPSGTSILSRADEHLAQTLKDIFDGSGIESQGLLAVAGGQFSYSGANARGDGAVFSRSIPDVTGSVNVPAIERRIAPGSVASGSISEPSEAKNVAGKFYDDAKGPGILLLTAQHGVAAWVPLPNEWRGKLSDTGGLNAILRAVSEANASAALIVHGGELDAKVGTDLAMATGSASTIAQNIGAALGRMDVRVLDIINAPEGRSAAERGEMLAAPAVFSRGQAGAQANDRAALRKALEAEFGADAVKALEDAGLLYVANVPPPGMPRNAAGVTSNGEIGLFAANTPARSTAVAYHEALHATLRRLLGDAEFEALMSRLGQIAESGEAKGFFAEALERIPQDTPAGKRNEELAAYAVEVYQIDRERLPGAVRAWVRELIAALRAALAKALRGLDIAPRARVRLLANPAVLHKLARDGLRAMAIEAGSDRAQTELGRASAFSLAVRSKGIPADAAEITSARSTDALKAHVDYRAAKAGDPQAAARLVRDLVSRDDLARAAREVGEGAHWVFPHAAEASGMNQIPAMLAGHYAAATGGQLGPLIVQTNRAFHTGADAMQRMIARPMFDGPVTPGARYVVVDDVSTMGGTLAELSDHIRAGGGRVVGVVTLANASRASTMLPSPKQIAEIERRYGPAIRETLHIEPSALTGAEAGYLIGFRDADELRNRVAAAQRQRGDRLRAKGVPAEAQGLGQEPAREEPGALYSIAAEPGAYPKDGGRDAFVRDIRGGGLLYAHKAKSRLLATTAGLQLPGVVRRAVGFSVSKYATEADLAQWSSGAPGGTASAPGGTASAPGADEKYSIAGEPDADGTAPARRHELSRRVRDRLNDMLRRDASLSPYRRALGYPYAIAHARDAQGQLRNPDFKAVYDRAQDYLTDINTFANDPAELAPDVVPQLNKLRDLGRQLRVAERDRKPLAAATYEGTLLYRRDHWGQPVLAQDDEPAGIVWTPEELRSRYGFNGRQVGLYEQTRASVDRSLDLLVAGEVARHLDKDMAHDVRTLVSEGDTDGFRQMVDAVLRRALSEAHSDLKAQRSNAKLVKPDNQAAEKRAQERVRAAEAEVERLAKLQKDIDEKYAKVARLQEGGYFPLMRFGTEKVTVRDADGKVQFFGLYESKAEANVVARRFKEAPGFAGSVQRGELSTEEFRLFRGVTPETLALFGDVLGTSGEQRELLDKYLQMTKANHSALRRMIRRKGTAGFSEDVQRTLAAMLTSNARAGAAALHAGMMDEAAQAIDERGETGRGKLKDYAVRFVEYVRNPGRESQGIRGLLFINFIGGSIASAMVNLTQTATQTYPYIASRSSPARATRIVSAAMRDAMRAPDPRSDLAQAIHHAEEEGIISPQALHELQGQALNRLGGVESLMRAMGVGTQASATVESAMRKLLFGWGGFFSLAEQYNRRVAFIAGYRLAVENGEADPIASAAATVNETQNVYNRGNRPEWARGPVGSVVMTYSQFKLNYIEFLSRLPPRYAGLALLALAVMSGLEGLPFSDDLDDLLDTLAQRLLGRAWSTKLERTRLLTALFNRETAEVLLHGASALPGFPADLAGRLSLGNMIPGTGAFLMANQGKPREVLEALGPAGGVVRDALQGEVAPIAARNLAKGIEAAQTGEFRNAKGEKMADATLGQAALKAIGFNPQKLARASRDRALVQRVIDQTRAVESEIVRAIATGIVDRKADRVNEAVTKLSEWNRKNPEFPIDVNEAQIAAAVKRLKSEREDRFIRSVPRELREAARGAMRAP